MTTLNYSRVHLKIVKIGNELTSEYFLKTCCLLK